MSIGDEKEFRKLEEYGIYVLNVKGIDPDFAFYPEMIWNRVCLEGIAKYIPRLSWSPSNPYRPCHWINPWQCRCDREQGLLPLDVDRSIRIELAGEAFEQFQGAILRITASDLISTVVPYLGRTHQNEAFVIRAIQRLDREGKKYDKRPTYMESALVLREACRQHCILDLFPKILQECLADWKREYTLPI